MLEKYFRSLYQRTMREAYSLAESEIGSVLKNGGKCLDCGASNGYKYHAFEKSIGLDIGSYCGIEWNAEHASDAQSKNLNVLQGDLNREIPFDDNEFRCVFALSVIEHLLNPCRYLNESYRVLEKGGTLVLLTPNISTYFTAALILLGKMPSSGPHPDSENLLKREEIFRKPDDSMAVDVESDTPIHRHLVVFSYRVLKSYLQLIGFDEIRGCGFGLYPFPNFMQPVLERLDPYHCHQMVFVARK